MLSINGFASRGTMHVTGASAREDGPVDGQITITRVDDATMLVQIRDAYFPDDWSVRIRLDTPTLVQIVQQLTPPTDR